VLVQTMSPEWARARVLAVFLLVTQGGLSAGSAIWGVIASRASIETNLDDVVGRRESGVDRVTPASISSIPDRDTRAHPLIRGELLDHELSQILTVHDLLQPCAVYRRPHPSP